MSIGNRMRGIGESVYYLDDLKPKMDELMGDVSYELNHEVGKRKLLVRLDGFGEEYKPQIETLMDEELPVGYRMEYDPFPLDFIKIDFLTNTFPQYIDTGIIPTAETGFYLHCFNSDSPMGAVETSANRIIVGRAWTTTRGFAYFSNYHHLKYSASGSLSNKPEFEVEMNWLGSKKIIMQVPKSGESYATTLPTPSREIPYTVTLFRLNNNGQSYGSIHRAKISDKQNIIRDFVPAIDSKGIPCMFDLVTKKPFYNKGWDDFIAGLTMKQALNLAKLPTPSSNNKLTISLPKEATLVQHNQQVEAALNAAAEKGWNIPVQYRDEFDDESIFNKYAECVTIADIVRVNPEFTEAEPSPYGDYDYYFTKDLTTDGDFPYNLPKFNSNQHWVNGGFFKHVFVDKFIIKLPALVNATATCCRCMSKEIVFDAQKATNMMYVFSDCANLEKATFTSSPTNIERICMSYGSMVLREIYGDFTKVTESAKQAFYNCRLNKETVLRICSELPTVSNKPITIGIHVDHQTDEEITEALTNLETKGWNLTIQWNGTPTAQSASTLGLRKPPIYAKLGVVELPNRTVEDYLDWGHYVSNWEENGYQEFASIEEAEEHFNIKKEITE